MATATRELTPPRAAAIAGVIFSLLLGASLAIVRLAAPDAGSGVAHWANDPARRDAVRLALQLVPFAGIAFLWFIGVLRNRLGAREDQFFATVFLGSGLLFVASLFASAGLSGALLLTVARNPSVSRDTETYYLIAQAMRLFLNVFAIRMAGVFIISSSTVMLRTGILPRWISFTGFACALVLLLIITSWPWIALLFPLWILIVSASILVSDLRARRAKPLIEYLG